MSNIEKYERKAVFSNLNEYCYLSKEHDYIEITEWKNGEGFDVCISQSNGDDTFQLTFGQFDAIKKLLKQLFK